jgi:hypothetical protein
MRMGIPLKYAVRWSGLKDGSLLWISRVLRMGFTMIRMGIRMRDFMMGVGIHMLGFGYR